MGSDLIAAVDLGSNSFRLQIGRVDGNQIYPQDNLKETVRLASGLGADKCLSLAACERGWAALARFREMLRGFAPEAVRAVATNTLRVAKNANDFLQQAEVKLGFPIEVIAGREEARLIYLGVAHSLPMPQKQQLVVDIGGGSTEFIIGCDCKPQLLESLYMGCVGYSLRFFPEGKVNKKLMKDAELAARKELQSISRNYLAYGWHEAVGSSGTAKALADLLELNGLNSEATTGITRTGLERLRGLLYEAGSVSKLKLQGLRSDRIPVLPGGLAIMSAVFRELNLERMTFAEGALRLGVLYDLLGRSHHEDMRAATVAKFMQRYEADIAQAGRVGRTAQRLLLTMQPTTAEHEANALQMLNWAACLHEIGISIAHSSYHKHSAYILEHADMLGFSRRDQQQIARLVLAHRGKLARVLPHDASSASALDWKLIFALRIAALLHRARDNLLPEPPVSARLSHTGFELVIQRSWLMDAPLTATALADEVAQWTALDQLENLGVRLSLQVTLAD